MKPASSVKHRKGDNQRNQEEEEPKRRKTKKERKPQRRDKQYNEIRSMIF
jgi:hypothetical protein